LSVVLPAAQRGDHRGARGHRPGFFQADRPGAARGASSAAMRRDDQIVVVPARDSLGLARATAAHQQMDRRGWSPRRSHTTPAMLTRLPARAAHGRRWAVSARCPGAVPSVRPQPLACLILETGVGAQAAQEVRRWPWRPALSVSNRDGGDTWHRTLSVWTSLQRIWRSARRDGPSAAGKSHP
jgi:hypothetical protein